MNPLIRLAAWWRAQRERKERDERLLAIMIVLTNSMPGNPPPPENVKQFVNRTLKRKVY